VPSSPIYLDHNSTTPIDPRVVEAMVRAWRTCSGNPASQHAAGREARRLLEDAREGIAEFLGARTGGMDADQVLFTSGGTEANNLAVFGLSGESKQGSGVRNRGTGVVVSAIEHPSVREAGSELSRRGYELSLAPVGGDGVVLVDRVAELIARNPPRLVSVMLANNETGAIQPIAEIAALCRARGVMMHTDAVQAVGKIAVSFGELGVDALTVAPHKFHGPLGIGALIIRHGVRIEPLLFGGFQQGGLRPGTENAALAAAFFEALRLWQAEANERESRMRSLRDGLEQMLLAELPETVIIGAAAPRLPNTSCVSFPGVNRQALVMALDLEGVACSTGSACASGSSAPSPTLVAMGLGTELIEGSIRLSLGAFSTAEQVADAARRIIKAVRHLRMQK
jgi:cysteine desulfurase